MSIVGPNFPTAATGNTSAISGGTISWGNPANIENNDGAVATCTLPSNAISTQISDDLIGSAFGFSIPSTDTIVGILLEVSVRQSTILGGGATENLVNLLKSGSVAGVDRSAGATPGTTLATVSYGSSADLWGTSWVPSDFSNIGAAVSYENATVAAIRTVSVDFFRITVFTHSVFNESLSYTLTSGIADGEAAKMNAAISTSAQSGFSNNATLNISTSLNFSSTSAAVEIGSDIPGTPQLNLSLTPAMAITGAIVTTPSALSFSLISSASEDGSNGATRGITLSTSGQVFNNVSIGGTRPLLPDVYTSLVTSEHNQRPKFMAMIAGMVQPYVDNINLLRNFVNLFDLDQAVGQQLDMVGVWIGVTRNIAIPLTGVYFSFNTSGLGFNQGTWFGIGDSASGLTVLSDGQYRLLLRAKIASNHWDGTVPGAYAIWAIVFQFEPFNITITDNQDMTMVITLLGSNIPAVTKALLTNGYIALVPAGVSVTYVT